LTGKKEENHGRTVRKCRLANEGKAGKRDFYLGGTWIAYENMVRGKRGFFWGGAEKSSYSGLPKRGEHEREGKLKKKSREKEVSPAGSDKKKIIIGGERALFRERQRTREQDTRKKPIAKKGSKKTGHHHRRRPARGRWKR